MITDCQYLERSNKVGSCIFSYNCHEECYFALKGLDDFVNELYKENKELTEELSYIENTNEELEQLRQENDEIEYEKHTVEQCYSSILDFVKEIIPNIQINKDELYTKIVSLDLLYDDNNRLLSILEETEET